MSFKVVSDFEKQIAKFFGAPYAVAVDCCTHGIELCLRYEEAKSISVPVQTYISIPLLAQKLNIELNWREEDWIDFYYLTHNVVDAAVLWKENSYIDGTYMCISFQFRKHLKLGRGGIILLDNKKAADALRLMAYDGRLPDVPWAEQNIKTMGYHYYMTPETAQMGIDKLPQAISSQPRQWTINDWPDLRKMEIFKK